MVANEWGATWEKAHVSNKSCYLRATGGASSFETHNGRIKLRQPVCRDNVFTNFWGLQPNAVQLCFKPGIKTIVCVLVKLCCAVVVPFCNTECDMINCPLSSGSLCKSSLAQWQSMVYSARYEPVANTMFTSLSASCMPQPESRRATSS